MVETENHNWAVGAYHGNISGLLSGHAVMRNPSLTEVRTITSRASEQRHLAKARRKGAQQRLSGYPRK